LADALPTFFIALLLLVAEVIVDPQHQLALLLQPTVDLGLGLGLEEDGSDEARGRPKVHLAPAVPALVMDERGACRHDLDTPGLELGPDVLGHRSELPRGINHAGGALREHEHDHGAVESERPFPRFGGREGARRQTHSQEDDRQENPRQLSHGTSWFSIV
jgi:hypothetical protein